MPKLSIEEQNQMIIRSRFPLERPLVKSENSIRSAVNEELVISVKQHRLMNGMCSKIQLLRSFIRTRPYIRTTFCK